MLTLVLIPIKTPNPITAAITILLLKTISIGVLTPPPEGGVLIEPPKGLSKEEVVLILILGIGVIALCIMFELGTGEIDPDVKVWIVPDSIASKAISIELIDPTLDIVLTTAAKGDECPLDRTS
jgi:hypothetical protein